VRLYTYFRSSCAYRVRIGLGLKGLDFESAFVHLRRGEQRGREHLERNPQGLVPTLIDGDTVLSQSLAILEYLDERVPDPPFLPDSPDERARARQIAYAIACEVQPLQNFGVLQRLKREFGATDEDTTRWVKGVIEPGLVAVEAMLEPRNSGAPFCCGQRPSLADICLVPQVYNARRFGCDLSKCPTVLRIAEHCETLHVFAKAAPEAQPDAEAAASTP